MRHKLLFTCAFLAALTSAAACARNSGNGEYGAAAAREALVKVGIHYRYGGSSPETGFDCSGLVAHVFQSAWGIVVPRRTTEQRSAGRAVKREDLAPGDLVFYNTRNRPFSHVGIYLGDGLFVHAPRRGQRVRLENMEKSYWQARFNGARRLTPPGV